MLRWGSIGRLACAAAVTFSLAGAAWAQDEGFDDLPALEEEAPADDMPPADDLPPIDEAPIDDMPPADDLPPIDEAAPDGSGSELPPLPEAEATEIEAPAGEAAAEPEFAGEAPIGEAVDVVEVESWYPSEEREFGPIMPDYRGAFELSLYTGWTIHDGRSELENGGSLHGGARLAANLTDALALDFDITVTRINLHATRRIQGSYVDCRGAFSISTYEFGATYRLLDWRFDLFTPYVRLAAGMVYVADASHKGLVTNGTTTQAREIRFPEINGAAFFFGFGFDYKIAKSWTFRAEAGLDLWVAEWLDRRSWLVNADTLRFGVVWHFE